MQLNFLEGIDQFRAVSGLSDRVQSFLLQHQAEHNLLLAMLLRWIDSPDYPERGTASHRFLEPPRIVFVEENGKILAVAFQTPPNNLVPSRCEREGVLALIAETLAHQQIKLPGVSGFSC